MNYTSQQTARERAQQRVGIGAKILLKMFISQQTSAQAGRSKIRKSGHRFSEKIMLKQTDEIMIGFNLFGS
jgi:hypothetical protein